MASVLALSTSSIGAQPTRSTSFQLALTPSNTMTVLWRPVPIKPVASPLPVPQQSPDAAPTSSDVPVANKLITEATKADTPFINQLLSVLQEALITKLQARVSLDKATVEKGRIHLSGVLLRDVDIGLRLSNDGARRLASALHDRYGQGADAPSWTRVLPLARVGIFNDFEVSLKLDELRLRELDLAADALEVEGFLIQADAGPKEREATTPLPSDTLQAILKVLQSIVISRAEAHLNLTRLTARRLRLSLNGLALKNLRVLVALRRADAGIKSSAPTP